MSDTFATTAARALRATIARIVGGLLMSNESYTTAVRDYERAQSRRYYAAHRERYRAEARARYAANREQILARKRACYVARKKIRENKESA